MIELGRNWNIAEVDEIEKECGDLTTESESETVGGRAQQKVLTNSIHFFLDEHPWVHNLSLMFLIQTSLHLNIISTSQSCL